MDLFPQKIGEGQFSKAYVCWSKEDSSQRYALKVPCVILTFRMLYQKLLSLRSSRRMRAPSMPQMPKPWNLNLLPPSCHGPPWPCVRSAAEEIRVLLLLGPSQLFESFGGAQFRMRHLAAGQHPRIIRLVDLHNEARVRRN